MHTGCARFDHRFRQFKDVQRAAEAGFRVGNDRSEPIDLIVTLSVGDLVGALQSLVDAFHHGGDAVRGIEALVGIHLPGEIRIRRDLPAAEIDRLQSSFHLLHRLVAGECAERRNEIFCVQKLPKLLRAAARERVLDEDAALQTLNVA